MFCPNLRAPGLFFLVLFSVPASILGLFQVPKYHFQCPLQVRTAEKEVRGNGNASKLSDYSSVLLPASPMGCMHESCDSDCTQETWSGMCGCIHEHSIPDKLPIAKGDRGNRPWCALPEEPLITTARNCQEIWNSVRCLAINSHLVNEFDTINWHKVEGNNTNTNIY